MSAIACQLDAESPGHTACHTQAPANAAGHRGGWSPCREGLASIIPPIQVVKQWAP